MPVFSFSKIVALQTQVRSDADALCKKKKTIELRLIEIKPFKLKRKYSLLLWHTALRLFLYRTEVVPKEVRMDLPLFVQNPHVMAQFSAM